MRWKTLQRKFPYEADELFETATARVRVNDEISSGGDPDNMDQVMGLFDGTSQPQTEVVSDPAEALDPTLPFHKVPWGLLVAHKNGIATDDILLKIRERAK